VTGAQRIFVRSGFGMNEVMTVDRLSTLMEASEDTCIDWKSDFPRGLIGEEKSDKGKGELLKDIASVANTVNEGIGYVVYGVKDHKTHREVVGASAAVCLDDADFQTWVRTYFDPPMEFQYVQLEPEQAKRVGIFIIRASLGYPHVVRASLGGVIYNGQVWHRQGSKNTIASRDELERMFKSPEPFLVSIRDRVTLEEVKQHYRNIGCEPEEVSIIRKDVYMARGWKMAPYPGTRRELQIDAVDEKYPYTLLLKPQGD
jgi:hypothetical protein